MKKRNVGIILLACSILVAYFIFTKNYVSGPVGMRVFVREAVERNDIKVCEKIRVSSFNISNTEESLRAQCKYTVAKRLMNENMCPGGYYAKCAEDIVELKRYLIDCGSKKDGEADACYNYVAFETYDIAICEKIINPYSKDYCKETVNTYYYIDKWDGNLGRVVLD